jgi:hypothetical protein
LPIWACAGTAINASTVATIVKAFIAWVSLPSLFPQARFCNQIMANTRHAPQDSCFRIRFQHIVKRRERKLI